VHFCLFVVFVVRFFRSNWSDGIVLFVFAENQSLLYDFVFVVLLREEARNNEIILFVVGIIDKFGPGREFLGGLIEANEGKGFW
jgi:F0F1-type ATP synthase assembly protein I